MAVTEPGPVLLTARGITVAFGRFLAVAAVDFEVREGELHALVGPNGAGKSTFLNVLGGQILQTAGEIEFLGRPLGRTTPHRRARIGIGRSFQLTSVIAGFSCLENVVLAVEARHGMLGMLRARPRGEDAQRARLEILKHLDGDLTIRALPGEVKRGAGHAFEISGRIKHDSLLAMNQEAACGTLVAGAGFEPATFGL